MVTPEVIEKMQIKAVHSTRIEHCASILRRGILKGGLNSTRIVINLQNYLPGDNRLLHGGYKVNAIGILWDVKWMITNGVKATLNSQMTLNVVENIGVPYIMQIFSMSNDG